MLLKHKGLTQKAVGDALGEAESTVSRVLAGTYPNRTERGRAKILKVARYVCKELGVEDPVVLFPELAPMLRRAGNPDDRAIAKAQKPKAKRARKKKG